MKNRRKIFGIFAVVAVMAAAGYGVLKNANQNELNDLALANIEALAWGNEVWIPDNANCSSTAPYPYCCTVIIHTYWTYPHW